MYFENIASYITSISQIISITKKIRGYEINGSTAIELKEKLKEKEVKSTEIFRKQSLHKHNTQMLLSLYFAEHSSNNYYPLNKKYNFECILECLLGKESSNEDINKALDNLVTLNNQFKMFYKLLVEELSN